MSELPSLPGVTVPFPYVLYTNCELMELLNHWVIQVGRDPRRSLVQPHGPRKDSYESTPHCSGLYPAVSWKLPRMETANFSWQMLPLLPNDEKIFFIYSLNFSWFHLWLLFLILQSCVTEDPGSISPVTSSQALPGCCYVPFKAISVPDWASPVPSASPYWASALAPNHLGALCWTCFSLFNVFVVLGFPKL